MDGVQQSLEEKPKKDKDINRMLKIILIIFVVLIVLLSIILAFLLINKESENDLPKQDQEETNEEDEEKTRILDIPSLSQRDAFEILDIMIAEYGEPNPKGLIKVLKELRGEEVPTFQTVTWVDIKYGYNFTFNFWTDGSLAREDSYYIIGYKSKGHTLEEILRLTNLERDSTDFIYKITDLGGAVFNIGITPKEAALKEEPGEKEIEEFTREEILEILQKNAETKWKNDAARIKLEYENQVKAHDWVISQTQYLDIMQIAKQEWGHDYVMVKWEFEKEVKAYEATL